MTEAMARAVLAGQRPRDVVVADDYPTEFSQGVAQQVIERGQPAAGGVGSYVIVTSDGIGVGEIGGALTSADTVEVGYAVVKSREGRGIATAALREIVRLLRGHEAVRRVVAHTPFDRRASGRVAEKAGFTLVGETTDEHEGQTIRVQEWELRIARGES